MTISLYTRCGVSQLSLIITTLYLLFVQSISRLLMGVPLAGVIRVCFSLQKSYYNYSCLSCMSGVIMSNIITFAL